MPVVTLILVHCGWMLLLLHNYAIIYHMATNFGEANIWRLAEKLQLAKF